MSLLGTIILSLVAIWALYHVIRGMIFQIRLEKAQKRRETEENNEELEENDEKPNKITW